MRALLCLALAGCARTAAAPEAEPRIITAAGVVSEIVFALGEGDRVVGVDLTTTYPPAATRLPRIGYQRQLAAEGLLSLRPTTVIVTSDAGPPAVLEQLRASGVRLLVVPAEPTRAGARRRIEAIATELGRSREGEALVARLDREVDAAVAEARAAGTRPRVLFLYGRGGGTVMVAGRKTAADEILALAGCDNAITDHELYRPLSGEALVAAAPDIILVPERALAPLGGWDGIAALPGVSATPAGRARRFVALDDVLLLGFGPRLGEGIGELSRRVRAWR